MGLHFAISGIEPLRQRLHPEQFRAMLISAIKEALEPTRAAVAAAAPRRSGRLASRITIKVARRGAGIRVFITGPGHGHLVERGHRMVIGGRVPRLGKHRTAKQTGLVVGQVPAHPFARPVVDADMGRITAEIQRRLVEAMNAA